MENSISDKIFNKKQKKNKNKNRVSSGITLKFCQDPPKKIEKFLGVATGIIRMSGSCSYVFVKGANRGKKCPALPMEGSERCKTHVNSTVVYIKERCKHVLAKGAKKGELCNAPAKVGGRCTRHSQVKVQTTGVKCKYVLVKGVNKGKTCSSNAKVDGYCNKHAPKSSKEEVPLTKVISPKPVIASHQSILANLEAQMVN
jgi:hypothetical protein